MLLQFSQLNSYSTLAVLLLLFNSLIWDQYNLAFLMPGSILLLGPFMLCYYLSAHTNANFLVGTP